MNQLAAIGKIIQVYDIQGADRIRQAMVDCGPAGQWSGVVGLDIQPDALVTVFMQDALLPPRPAWAFMEKYNWRVRMARFKGVPSECLIMPLVIEAGTDLPEVGTDIAASLGITKYNRPLPTVMGGDTLDNFPSFIPKTDEPNFQTVPKMFARMEVEAWTATLKCDGTSCTVWNDEQGQMHVASRNWELREFTESGASNLYWRTARWYLMDKIPPGMALQFEIVGPSVQGNPMGLDTVEARAFSLYDYRERRYLSQAELEKVCERIGMSVAQVLYRGDSGCYLTADDLRAMANVRYANGQPGEGIVMRGVDGGWSFKVLNLEYSGDMQ
jgi:RNA ligase (TIGR02306 family)